MFSRKIKTTFEKVDPTPHPQYENVKTEVSEYFRKYGQGKIEDLPHDSRQEVVDNRSADEMLDSDEFEPNLGTDELDVMAELERMKDRYQQALDDFDVTVSQKERFDEAVKIINDPNATSTQTLRAYAVIDELERSGKIKRARAK